MAEPDLSPPLSPEGYAVALLLRFSLPTGQKKRIARLSRMREDLLRLLPPDRGENVVSLRAVSAQAVAWEDGVRLALRLVDGHLASTAYG